MFSLPRTVEPSPSPTGELAAQVDEAVDATVDVVTILAWVAVGVAIGLFLAILTSAIVKAIAHRHPVIDPAIKKLRRPLQFLFMTGGGLLAFLWATRAAVFPDEPAWRHPIFHLALILIIVLATWFVAALVTGFEDAVITHVENTGTKRAKRIQTQFQIVRRVLVVLIWILGIAGILMTFPVARTAGASLMASAGIVSVIAGLAAQSTLGNVFAGLQVAFTDSLRVDDIVIYNTEYCVVEEITLTYVVLKVWDGRRIIVPSSKLTTEAFENWTRRTPDIMAHVKFDLDWQVPIDAMRAEMMRLLDATDLWDRRTAVLQVVDAEGGQLKIQILLSAKDSSTLTDLKYYMRERMVKWIQFTAPKSIPYQRHIALDFDQYDARMAKYPDLSKYTEPELDVHDPETKLPPRVADLEATTVLRLDDMPNRVPVADRPINEGFETSTGPVTASGVRPGHEASIFTGSAEADKRAQNFSGPGDDEMEERERRAKNKEKSDDELS